PVLLPALGVGAVSLLLFVFAHGFLTLLVARILSGFAVGAFAGAGTAALIELEPLGDTRRAATHAATTSVGGFALGPLIGGVFVQYGPWPLRLVYLVSLALLVPAFVGVVLMRETMTERRALDWRPQRLLVLLPAGVAFLVAALLTASLPLFVTGALIGGIGQGLAYLGGQALVEQVTPADRRSEIFSAYLIVVYASGSTTAVSLGFAAKGV